MKACDMGSVIRRKNIPPPTSEKDGKYEKDCSATSSESYPMPPILPAPNDLPEDVSDDDVSSGDVEPPPVMLMGDSDSGSYSDEENPTHEGYELLPQDPDAGGIVFEDTDTSEDLGIVSGMGDAETGNVLNPVVHSLFTQATSVPASEDQNVDTSPEPHESDFHPMDQEHIEKIKAAMKGFTLPSSCVPSWASIVPEDEWKANLFTHLDVKKKNGANPPKNSKSKATVTGASTSKDPESVSKENVTKNNTDSLSPAKAKDD